MFKLLALVALATAALGATQTLAQVQEEQTIRSSRRGTPPVVARGEEEEVRWIGIAVSRDGRVFTKRDQGYEDIAKTDALNGCERRTSRSCRAISVADNWDVVAIACSSGPRNEGFVGGSMANGSGSSYDRAEEIARNKASDAGFSYTSCHKVFEY